jgi:hypothetical protein
MARPREGECTLKYKKKNSEHRPSEAWFPCHGLLKLKEKCLMSPS